MGYTDLEILSAIHKGDDRNVLTFLYTRLFPKVKKYIRDHSGDTDVAYDIFQDGILVFYKYVKTNKFDPKYEIGGFVFSVCKNLWLNRLARDKRMAEMPDYFDSKDGSVDMLTLLINEEREKEISRIMQMLGVKCEELLKYSIFYKLRNTEICDKMGFSTENAVKTQKYKCMQKLILLVEENPSVKRIINEI